MLTFSLVMTGAFSWNTGKLFFELKVVTDNLLFMYEDTRHMNVLKLTA